MSHRRRRRMRRKSSPPSLPISRPEASTEPRSPEFTILPAQSDQDVALIHAFLCQVAGPSLLAPINPEKSIAEVYRVVKEEAAFVAEASGGALIGTIGIVYADWWYALDGFLTDRWCFVSPEFRHRGVFEAMLVEADELAAAAGVPFIFNGKARRAHRGAIFTSPRKVN